MNKRIKIVEWMKRKPEKVERAQEEIVSDK